jgi:hypothetical protein
MPHAASDDCLQSAGINRADVDSHRNGILLALAIEKAFKRLDVSFVPVSILETRKLKMKIWTPPGLRPVRGKHPGDVRPLPLWSGSRQLIGAFEGDVLFCGANSVLKRALSYQALLAYRRARSNHWLNDDEEAPFDSSTPTLCSEFQFNREAITKWMASSETIVPAAGAFVSVVESDSVSESPSVSDSASVSESPSAASASE